jgi:hypothetical protein
MTVGTFTLGRPGDYIVWGPGIDPAHPLTPDIT